MSDPYELKSVEPSKAESPMANEPEWYYAQNGQQSGPVAATVIIHLISTGQLPADSLVWKKGLPQWQPVTSVPEFASVRPPENTRLNQIGYMSPPTDVYYAGFWIRFVAAFIDGIILQVGSMIIGGLLGAIIGAVAGASGMNQEAFLLIIQLVSSLAGIIATLLYYALMESSVWQATLGKRAMGIVVTDLNGDRISFPRALGRVASKYISILTLLIGYIIAAFHPQKRALHDLIAGTVTVRGRSN